MNCQSAKSNESNNQVLKLHTHTHTHIDAHTHTQTCACMHCVKVKRRTLPTFAAAAMPKRNKCIFSQLQQIAAAVATTTNANLAQNSGSSSCCAALRCATRSESERPNPNELATVSVANYSKQKWLVLERKQLTSGQLQVAKAV